ncbi:MAG: BMP family ABC transporter substrate-binding protein, partial [Chloroflexi bacterium]|nr:BMP family ABC transporter substrate-binding protein [Chloroflexota bacterium]
MSAALAGSLLFTACAAPAAPAPAAAPAAPAAAAAAGGAAPAAPAAPAAAAKGIQLKPGEKLKVGFLYVGPKDDYGYNQAADQGRVAMEKKLGNVETVFAENVPENAEAERVMEQMIRGGAKIIFPTSYGHLDSA